jgi:hypothetical protein
LGVLSESTDVYFTDDEIDFLEQYNIPIYGMLEELRDPSTSVINRSRIRQALSIILEDGGFWGETVNAHTSFATNLKRKVEMLRNSI